MTQMKGSPRLQVIRPVGLGSDPHLYGTISITGHEAEGGTRKMISISRGVKRKLFQVTIPPQISDGKMLRLRGLGKQVGTDQFGDLLLKVTID